VEVLKDARRQSYLRLEGVEQAVKDILRQVREGGDTALLELTRLLDGVSLDHIPVARDAIREAYGQVSQATLESLRFAAAQVEFFARQQAACLQELECSSIPGVTLGHRLIPVERCAAYVPGGRYPLPSSALMSIIPANVAGVRRVAACSPPSREHGGIHPAVLVAMDIAGAGEVYCMGGAQAIAAFTYGTESVPQVDLVVGPGNIYVTEAKRQVAGAVGIDLLAGPSEALIIADDSALPVFVAADLLATCEHDPNSVALLVTPNRDLATRVLGALDQALEGLPTAALAREAWDANGRVILVDSLEEAVRVSNEIAPEHLQVMTLRNDEIIPALVNYGSLFVGDYSPVAFGDYCSGTNHTLPTMGSARFASGLWVGTFTRVAPYQRVTREGASRLASACTHLSGVEGLFAHQRSADLRRY
jgi:histidinol dehydrogenase/sulfopropanediol 3-dehydrogenase